MSRATDTTTNSEDWVLEQLGMYGQWLTGPANVGLSSDQATSDEGVVFIDPSTTNHGAGGSHARSAEQVSIDPGSRHAWIAAAVAVAVALAAWAVVGLSNESEEPAVRMDLVLDGEQVISTDPLIVLPVPVDAPLFDTSGLGEDVSVQPATSMGPEYQALIDGFYAPTGTSRQDQQQIIKVSLVGTLDGEPWAMIVSDGPDTLGWFENQEGDVLRLRTPASPGRFGSSGDKVFADTLDLVAPPETISGSFGLSYPVGWFIWDELSPEVSVVSFADADRNLWVRPSGGVAIFRGQFDDGESWTVTAYDKNGSVLETRSDVGGRASDNADSIPAFGEVIEDLGVGSQDGTKPTLVLLGAGWCVPCNQDVSGLIDGLSGIDDQVNVYSKVLHADGLEWPAAEFDWPYEQLDADGPVFAQWGSVPLAVLLDAENRLVSYDKSLAQLGDDLEALGVDLGNSDFWN